MRNIGEEGIGQIAAHPSTLVAGAAAVAVVIAVSVIRRSRRALLAPLAIGMGLLAVAIATLSAMRHVLQGFGTESLAGSKGVGPAAAVILESRYQGLAAGFVLLVVAALAIVVSAARGEEPASEPPVPPKPSDGILIPLLFLLSSMSVFAMIVLTFWEMSQASWLMRTLAEGPLDFKALTRTGFGDVHGRLGLSLAGLGWLCFISVGGGLLLAVLSLAIPSPSRPPRWFDVGNRLLLAVVVVVSLTSLVRGSAQRSWLRNIAATGKVPGVSPPPTATSSVSPCLPHPVASGIAELSAGFTEPMEVSRVKPKYPEEARLARIQGVVVLEAVIGPEGKVRSVCVLRGVHPLLDAAAERAVMQWTYEPATRKSDGSPVAVYLKVTVTFRLE